MRKTLLIAAAALAASVISSRAQVYSQNIVGYVNIPLTNGVFSVVAPALDADGTGTNNTVSSIFTTPMLGDTVYSFNGSSYDVLNYKSVGSGHPVVYTTNWFLGSTAEPNYPLNPGKSVFYLPAANQTVTEVGVALTGTLTNQYFPTAGGITLLASKSPVGGGLTSVLGYTPVIGDTVFIYDNGAYDVYNYKVVGTGHPVVYSTNWFLGSTAEEPVINVGQGFWLQSAGANSWTETVNP